jgi:hypothetical protein
MTKEVDELVPDPRVAEEFAVSLMTLWRWSRDPALQFPPAVQIRRRNFRSRRALEEFKARLVQSARRVKKSVGAA